MTADVWSPLSLGLAVWFWHTYGRPLQMADLDRAEAWHLQVNPGWSIWNDLAEAELTVEQWVAALEATAGQNRR